MLYLSDREREQWRSIVQDVCEQTRDPETVLNAIRPNLRSAFCFYAGVELTLTGRSEEGVRWLTAGTFREADGLFSNAFLLGFLKRRGGELSIAANPFDDPKYYVHFTTVPHMKESRTRFLHHISQSVPIFDHPISLMDIGCGDGSLTAAVISSLTESGKIPGIEKILLVDSSPAMISLATETIQRHHPGIEISTANSRIENLIDHITTRYDIAVSSLAYHHMQVEEKEKNLAGLKPWIDHFILFEVDANNDAPLLHSPELALSVYQLYGRIIDFIFSHDAEVEIAVSSVDMFLMSELVSLMTQERGVRADYHMPKTAWHALFRKILGPEFTLRCDSDAYADDYLAIFTLHYGRE